MKRLSIRSTTLSAISLKLNDYVRVDSLLFSLRNYNSNVAMKCKDWKHDNGEGRKRRKKGGRKKKRTHFFHAKREILLLERKRSCLFVGIMYMFTELHENEAGKGKKNLINLRKIRTRWSINCWMWFSLYSTMVCGAQTRAKIWINNNVKTSATSQQIDVTKIVNRGKELLVSCCSLSLFVFFYSASFVVVSSFVCHSCKL